MKKIIINTWDKYVMNVSDDEYQSLNEGLIDITDLIEEKEHTEDMTWKNGGTDWE